MAVWKTEGVTRAGDSPMGNPPPLGREMNPIQEQEPDLMGNVLTVAVRVGRSG